MAKVGNYLGPRGGELTWSLTSTLKMEKIPYYGCFSFMAINKLIKLRILFIPVNICIYDKYYN